MWHYCATLLKSTLLNKVGSGGSEILAKWSQGSGLRNSIIIELGIGFNIAFSNSIGIGIEIGFAKKSRPVLLLVLVLQFTLSQYWYWYCYRKTQSHTIGIGIVIAKHLQQILSLLLELYINFSSIDVNIAS